MVCYCSTYKLPTVADIPRQFNVRLLRVERDTTVPESVYSSKGAQLLQYNTIHTYTYIHIHIHIQYTHTYMYIVHLPRDFFNLEKINRKCFVWLENTSRPRWLRSHLSVFNKKKCLYFSSVFTVLYCARYRGASSEPVCFSSQRPQERITHRCLLKTHLSLLHKLF